MGFYGDHLDRGKVAFQFDRVFNNRKSMDQLALTGNDGVFAGRFVLIKYDPEGKFFEGDVTTGYYNEGIIYADSDLNNPYVYKTFTKVNSPSLANWESYYQKVNNYYFKLPNQTYFNEDMNNYYTANTSSVNSVYLNQLVRIYNENLGFTQTYYKCTGGIEGEGSIATWELVNFDNTDSEYLRNYNIDKITYGNDFDLRGYDATVWEKVYTQGQGKFLLIAYLNTMIPAIELFADPPSDQSVTPYIDALSSDALYRVHIPSMYGFRIKEWDNTLSYPSDQSIIQKYYTYDSNNNILNSTNRSINADIYFNKAGMTPAIRNYDNSVLNEILIKPTGASGKTYYDKDGNLITTDLYELSIHLPMIGNIISNFYDLIYTEERHLDIDWYSPLDANMRNGNPGKNFKTFDLNSVAGLINDFHNKLGQIIVKSNSPITDSNAGMLNQNYIYNYEDNYYRVGYDYDYVEIPEYSPMENLTASSYEPGVYYTKTTINGQDVYNIANGSYSTYEGITLYRKNISYTPVDISQEDYLPNTYYVQNVSTNEYVPATEVFSYYPRGNLGAQFYQKNVSIFKFEKVDLIGYSAGRFFYLDKDYNYIADNQELVPTYKTIPYYEITASNEVIKTFSSTFPSTFYRVEENGSYVKATETTPIPEEHYYEINPEVIATNAILYQPNRYYYYLSYDSYGRPLGKPQPATETSVIDAHKPYWYIPLSDELTYVEVDGKIVVGRKLDTENQVIINVFSTDESLDVIYYLNNGKYIPVEYIEELSVARNYFKIESPQEKTDYFLPNTYYRKDNNTGTYYLQETWTGNNTTEYIQLINIEPLTIPFYEGEKYYWYTGTIYDIDHNASMTPNRQYFIGKSLYVLEDSSERWPYGFEWREQAVFVPASVTLATRKEVIRAFNLQGINNGESSINGAILNFNKLVDNVNIDTRDNRTLTGAINNAKDLLQSIHSNLIPGRILYINDFGQIATSPYSIDQLKTLLS